MNDFLKDIIKETEDYFSEILTEARFKDVKAKYSQYMGLVDSARDYIKGKLGDKGVSKYILYVMKETHRMMGEPETKYEVLKAGKDDIIDVMFNLIDLVEKFDSSTAFIDHDALCNLLGQGWLTYCDVLGQEGKMLKKKLAKLEEDKKTEPEVLAKVQGQMDDFYVRKTMATSAASKYKYMNMHNMEKFSDPEFDPLGR